MSLTLFLKKTPRSLFFHQSMAFPPKSDEGPDDFFPDHLKVGRVMRWNSRPKSIKGIYLPPLVVQVEEYVVCFERISKLIATNPHEFGRVVLHNIWHQHDGPHQALLERCIRWIAVHIQKQRPCNHRALVRELLKAPFSMVCTKTTFTTSSKWYIRIHQMQGRIID